MTTLRRILLESAKDAVPELSQGSPTKREFGFPRTVDEEPRQDEEGAAKKKSKGSSPRLTKGAGSPRNGEVGSFEWGSATAVGGGEGPDAKKKGAHQQQLLPPPAQAQQQDASGSGGADIKREASEDESTTDEPGPLQRKRSRDAKPDRASLEAAAEINKALRPPPRNASKKYSSRNGEEGEEEAEEEVEDPAPLAEGSPAKKKKKKPADDEAQLTWVQCERCQKWRDVPASYTKKLPQHWYCQLNTWELEYASCDAKEKEPADESDSDEEEDVKPGGDEAAAAAARDKKKKKKKKREPAPQGEGAGLVAGGSSSSSSAAAGSSAAAAAAGGSSSNNNNNNGGGSSSNPGGNNSSSSSSSNNQSSSNSKSAAAGGAGAKQQQEPSSKSGSKKRASSEPETQRDRSKSAPPQPSSKSGAKPKDAAPAQASKPGTLRPSISNMNMMGSKSGLVPQGEAGKLQAGQPVPQKKNWNWVMCETCQQWRKLPPEVDVERLPEKWFCHMNKWDKLRASCSAAQEADDGTADAPLEPPAARDALVRLPDGVNLYGGQYFPIKGGRKNVPLNYRELIVNHYRHFNKYDTATNAFLNQRYHESSLFVPRGSLRSKSAAASQAAKKQLERGAVGPTPSGIAHSSRSSMGIASAAIVRHTTFRKVFGIAPEEHGLKDKRRQVEDEHCEDGHEAKPEGEQEAAAQPAADKEVAATKGDDQVRQLLDADGLPAALLKIVKPWKRAGGWIAGSDYYCQPTQTQSQTQAQ
jgi:hypothetical protein